MLDCYISCGWQAGKNKGASYDIDHLSADQFLHEPSCSVLAHHDDGFEIAVDAISK